jgi:hypothetical protein
MTEEWTVIETDLIRDMKLVCETVLQNNLDAKVVTIPPTNLLTLAKRVLRSLEELDEEEVEE